MPAAYPNSQRPSGGRILSVYFAADELEKLRKLSETSGERRNAVIRRIVREHDETPAR